MKAVRFLCHPAKIFIITIVSLYCSQSLLAQPKFIYDFENPVLQSGTDLTVGAVYLFSKVNSTTDALVKINAISGGTTVSAIDNTGSGYAQAFQPVLNVPLATTAKPKINTYAEFYITFIATGTYNKTTGTYTATTQPNVPATALDIDGTTVTTPAKDSLFEYDLLDLGTGSYVDYNSAGGQLTFTHTGTAVTGQTFTALNYSGIDTTATAVMFTDIQASLTTTLIFRTGIITELPAATASRVTSLAFFKPVYPYSVLPVQPVEGFAGTRSPNAVNLQWQLTPGNELADLSLQRAEGSSTFQDIAGFPISTQQSLLPFNYSDPTNTTTGNIQYRLKMTTVDNLTTYSNILSFQPNAVGRSSFRINPTLVNHNALLNVSIDDAATGLLKLEDYTGRELYRQTLALNKGSNSIPWNVPDKINPGNYLAVLLVNKKVYTQPFVIIR